MQFSILFESTNVITPNDIVILESEAKNKEGTERVIFKTKLQTANEINSNKRYYTNNICKTITESLRPAAKSRCLFQEVDHPFMNSTDDMINKKRAVTVELRNCGSLIRDIYMEGDDIVGEIQTLSGFQGPSLRDLIVKDKANIGFSLRMLGTMKAHPTMEGVSIVSDPIRPVTYDIVTNPAHKSARVLSFIPESSMEYVSGGLDVMTESEIVMLENAHLPTSSKKIIDEYLLDVLRKEFSTIKTFKFEF